MVFLRALNCSHQAFRPSTPGRLNANGEGGEGVEGGGGRLRSSCTGGCVRSGVSGAALLGALRVRAQGAARREGVR